MHPLRTPRTPRTPSALTVLVAILALVLAVTFAGCVELSTTTDQGQTLTGPSPTPEPEPDPERQPGPAGTITLTPAGGTISVGEALSVQVVVRDHAGAEVPTQDLRTSIANPAVLVQEEVTDRTVTLRGLAVGETSVIVSASGLTTSMIVRVEA